MLINLQCCNVEAVLARLWPHTIQGVKPIKWQTETFTSTPLHTL